MNATFRHAEISPDHFRATIGNYCSGLTIISARTQAGDLVGLTCQSFHSLSLDPPLVAFFAAKTSTSYQKIRQGGSFCVNILSDQQAGVATSFARSGADKWAGISWSEDHNGDPVIDGVLASISCRIEQEVEGGDHYIMIGRVNMMRFESDRKPLLYFRGRFAEMAGQEN